MDLARKLYTGQDVVLWRNEAWKRGKGSCLGSKNDIAIVIQACRSHIFDNPTL
jgi:hypothetical protein